MSGEGCWEICENLRGGDMVDSQMVGDFGAFLDG